MNLKAIVRTISACSILFTINANAQLSLQLDRDFGTNPWTGAGYPIIPTLTVDGDVTYDSFSHTVTIQSKTPVICNRSFKEYTASSDVFLRLLDPNGQNHADDLGSATAIHYLGLEDDVLYDFTNKQVSVKSDERLKSVCLSSYDFDVIYKDAFGADPDLDGLYYNLISEPQTGYTPGDTVYYQLIYQNNTNDIQTVDFKEYFSKSSSGGAYFSSQQGFLCRVLDVSDVELRPCSYDSETNSVYDEVLNPGDKIRISPERVISNSSVIGEKIEMMGAVFVKGLSFDSPTAGGNIPVFTDFIVKALSLEVVAPN